MQTQQEWLIEEELIEWFVRTRNTPYGREMRPISPTGEIVGRRLARSMVTEDYFLLSKNGGYSWFYPSAKPTVFVAPLPNHIMRRWGSRSLIAYRSDAHGILYGDGQWKLLEKDFLSRADWLPEEQCTRRLVERYRYIPSLGDPATVEWRVCLSAEPPLLGRLVPIRSELWWNGQLRRRHTLLHYRTATPKERDLFQPPRGAETRQVELEHLFSPISEFVPVLLEE